jgi:tetratricopeptide (TPR) repeat protein
MANESNDNGSGGPPADLGKGKAFFDRADQVAATANWDFAIQMYLEGIKREPSNIEHGHSRLWIIGLTRKANGGKPVGMIESMRLKTGREPVDALANAEYLMAKDPGNTRHIQSALKAAEKLGVQSVTTWLAELLFTAERQAAKPTKRGVMLVSKSFEGIGEFTLALAAAEMAGRLDPKDEEIQDAVRHLAGLSTIQKGQYTGEGGFEHSVVNIDKQKDLAESDNIVKSETFLDKQIAKARQEYEASPDVPGKVDGLVDALLKSEKDSHEAEAIDVLKKAYERDKMYRWQLRADDVRIRQIRRRYTKLVAEKKIEEARNVARELLAVELESYAQRAVKYPTDLPVRFELGKRQFMAGRFDEAIESLQHAQRDPKRRVQATLYLGQAFEKKGWFREAVETYERAMESELSEERTKEVHYLLGRALRGMGEKQKALDHFSAVAQIDFGYKDVRAQIEELRKEIGEGNK